MVVRKTTRWLALTATLALALPAAAAQANSGGPVATAAGGDVAPVNPAVVGVPIQRTEEAVSNAADAIDAGDGAGAAASLTASRRYLLRSYSGAKYLIAHPPPAPAEEGSASPLKFRKLARSFIRAAHRGDQRGWIKAHASQDDAGGPVIADGVTAVFNVLTSQYGAATAAVGMAPDTKGELLAKVQDHAEHGDRPAQPPREGHPRGRPAGARRGGQREGARKPGGGGSHVRPGDAGSDRAARRRAAADAGRCR